MTIKIARNSHAHIDPSISTQERFAIGVLDAEVIVAIRRNLLNMHRPRDGRNIVPPVPGTFMRNRELLSGLPHHSAL
jgi:hypothetical protein